MIIYYFKNNLYMQLNIVIDYLAIERNIAETIMMTKVFNHKQ